MGGAYQAQGTDEDDPDRGVGALGQEALAVDVVDGGQGAGHVTDLTSTVSEDHAASREHLHRLKTSQLTTQKIEFRLFNSTTGQ